VSAIAEVAPRRHRRSFTAATLTFAQSQAGSPAIEFALVAPALFLLVLGTIEVGRTLWTLSALHFSVEEAARCGSVDSLNCGTTSQVQAFAAGRSGAGFDQSVFTVTLTGCGIQVSGNYTMQINIPMVSPSITLRAQSCYPI
jgi:Flp pilus assembly protein TadG